MEKEYDENGKVDKGFEPVYWNLSYRRKFIRTLWFLPCIAAVILVMIVLNVMLDVPVVYTVFVAASLLVIEAAQLIFNYRQWKRDEENNI